MFNGTLAERAARLYLKDHTQRAPIGTRITPPTPPPIIGKIAESGTPEPRPASPEPWSSSRPTMPSSGGATPEDFGLKSGGGAKETPEEVAKLRREIDILKAQLKAADEDGDDGIGKIAESGTPEPSISPKRIDYGSNVRRSKRDVDPHTKHGLFSALASDAGLPPGEPTPKDPWASYGRPEPVTPRYEQLPTPPPIIGKIAESGTPEPRPASPEPWSSSRPTMPPPGVATPEDFGLKSGGGKMITQDQLDRLGVSNRKSMDVSPFLPGWKLIYSKLGDRWAVSCHAIDK